MHKLTTRIRPLLVCLVLAAVAANCAKGSPTEPTATPPSGPPVTTFAFTSDPASLVGRGQSPSYTIHNASFQWFEMVSQRVQVIVQAKGAADWSWRFNIESRRGQKLVPGTYQIGPDLFFELVGGGNSCGAASGTLTIEDILVDGMLMRFRANYSVSCNNTPPVNGVVVINFVPGVGLT